MFMKSDAEKLRNRLMEFTAPRYETIPNFDLYMDQVILYINKSLAPLNFNAKEKILTRSMINNYVKNSIVKPPEKKKYKSYHIVYLMVVCILKRCYSLKEIQNLISIYSNIEDSNSFNRDFNKFMSVFEVCLHEVLKKGSCSNSFFEEPTKEQQLMINVITTVVYKLYAELAIIEMEEEVSDHPMSIKE